jgi:hypothetical protein
MKYTKKEYCENCNSILGYECTYTLPIDKHSNGILTIEHWDGNPNNNLPDNLLTLCGNCARYKTNLYQDWSTPGRNLKRVEGSSWVNPIDFIWKDWVAYCNSSLFPKIKNNIGIIVGKTGQGKTFSITKYMIPEWSKPKHDLQLVIVSAPQTGILDEIDFRVCAATNGWLFSDNPQSTLELLEGGYRVIHISTHKGLVSKNGKNLIKYCKATNIKHSIIIDEAHTWLCTDLEVYKQTVGWNTNDYSAVLYNLLSEVSSYNPYVFGLTATPNGQQTGKVPINNSQTTFQIINKSCPVQLLLPKQAWIKEHTYLNLENVEETFDKIKQRIIEIENSKLITGVKKTLLLSCSIDGYNNPYEVSSVLKKVNEIYLDLGIEDDFKTCVMTSKKNESYTPDGSIEQENETSLKRKLNNNEDPLSVILVVHKGTMGMNIPTMSGVMVLKRTDKDDGNGLSLTEFSRQLMGRLVRINVCNQKDLKGKYNYDFSEYYKTLSDTERLNAIEANSFFVDIPANNQMWELAIQEFRQTYVNTVEFATESLNKL